MIDIFSKFYQEQNKFGYIVEKRSHDDNKAPEVICDKF